MRRKLGIVSLVVACVFAAAWVRSVATLDTIYLSGMTKKCLLISGGQKFYAMPADQFATYVSQASKGSVTWEEVRIVPLRTPFPLAGRYYWNSMPATHVLGIYQAPEDMHPIATMIPFWWIVIPLTLLSAWLLLSRIRKPTTTAEPAPSKA